MDSEGRLTVPAAARAALHVEGQAQFELEIVEDALILRPTRVEPDDAWAYTPEHLARVERAREQARVGRTVALTEGDLEQLPGC